MKVALVVAIVALFALVSVDAAGHRFNLNLPVHKLFDEWLVVYPQHFANPAARTKCFTIFKENVVEIKALNKKHPHAHFDLNKFSCIHKDEFKRTHHNAKPPTTEQWNSIPPIPEDKKRALGEVSIPRSFDWYFFFSYYIFFSFFSAFVLLRSVQNHFILRAFSSLPYHPVCCFTVYIVECDGDRIVGAASQFTPTICPFFPHSNSCCFIF